MDDLISRADAIEAVAEEWLSEACAESPYVNDDDIGGYRKLAEKLFEDIPSADAVQGEWDSNQACSICGCQPWYEHDIHTLHYCPNCGARMKGGDDE